MTQCRITFHRAQRHCGAMPDSMNPRKCIGNCGQPFPLAGMCLACRSQLAPQRAVTAAPHASTRQGTPSPRHSPAASIRMLSSFSSTNAGQPSHAALSHHSPHPPWSSQGCLVTHSAASRNPLIAPLLVAIKTIEPVGTVSP